MGLGIDWLVLGDRLGMVAGEGDRGVGRDWLIVEDRLVGMGSIGRGLERPWSGL